MSMVTMALRLSRRTSLLYPHSIEGFGGLEIGVQHQALLAEDSPVPRTSGVEQGARCGRRSATNNIEVQGSNVSIGHGCLRYAGERAGWNLAQCLAQTSARTTP
ncbi:hypothetical protein AALO_G00111760 [Alosa alosa]|uniref:Uncharacterized protein n=1 Tax=Alosa alosa TaxID=278164 RepID=A0AAV6GP83_9TELE|nr:hypothetical protein AALO_G00111760 [Alosa alosa]